MFSRDKSQSGARRKPAAPTIISADMTLRGDLASEGEIQVDGTIEGDVQGARLSVGQTGAITGAMSADSALVRGRVNGQIRARVVALTKTAKVKGDVFHETLSIEPGAEFEGHCKRLNAVEDTDQDGVGINLVVSDGLPTLPRS